MKIRETEKTSNGNTSQLIRLIQETPLLTPMNPWWRSYIDEPETTIPHLWLRFKELRKRFSDPEPVFLDCGCGDGVVMTMAGSAGFKPYGIEIDDKVAVIAQEINQWAFQKGVVPCEGKVAVGSYYLPQFADDLEIRMLEELERRFWGCEYLDFTDFGDYLEEVLARSYCFLSGKTVEEKIAFILGKIGPKPYQELGFLQETNEGLKFAADLVYIFPADLFFEKLFFDQWGRVVTKADFLVAVMRGSGGGNSLDTGIFEKKDSLSLSFSSCPEMRIDIFGK